MKKLAIFQEASRNEKGDLIKKDGNRKKINVSKLFAPGKRQTSNVQILVAEARLADEKDGIDNPAFPVNERIANAALEQIDSEGIEPAWFSGPSEYKP